MSGQCECAESVSGKCWTCVNADIIASQSKALEMAEENLRQIAETIIPVITDDHEAKWAYLKLATDMREIALSSIRSLRTPAPSEE